MGTADRGRARRMRRRALVFAMLAVFLDGCGMMRLRDELRILGSDYLVAGRIVNAPDYEVPVWVTVIQREADGRIVSADAAEVGALGDFAFMLRSPDDQYVVAFADSNLSESYDVGEPAWVLFGFEGKLFSLRFEPKGRRTWVVGRLSEETVIPADLMRAGQEFFGDRHVDEVMAGLSIPVAAGEVADLDDERFSAARGAAGLWEPVSFPMDTGVGIFFLEPYDPARIPILFVYGAGGSVQGWRPIFDALDRDRFQAWFYHYPTGRRLDETAGWLAYGVDQLREFYGLDRIGLVAHSMGGLVSRAFLNKSIGARMCVDVFVTISTPWAGHEQAKSGVDRAPVVVPAWEDLAHDSSFLSTLFAPAFSDLPPHHLIFSYRGTNSLILPASNDGTVSVASQLRSEAQEAAVRSYGFDATHAGVLESDAAIETLNRILAGAF